MSNRVHLECCTDGNYRGGFQSVQQPSAPVLMVMWKLLPGVLLPPLCFLGHGPSCFLGSPLGFRALHGVTCFTSYILFYNIGSLWDFKNVCLCLIYFGFAYF